MNEFVINKCYCFTGDEYAIEKGNYYYLEDRTIYLGPFIQYIDFPCGSDSLYQAKAQFQFGILSCSYYNCVFLYVTAT